MLQYVRYDYDDNDNENVDYSFLQGKKKKNCCYAVFICVYIFLFSQLCDFV